jgi:hypothetical protein
MEPCRQIDLVRNPFKFNSNEKHNPKHLYYSKGRFARFLPEEVWIVLCDIPEPGALAPKIVFITPPELSFALFTKSTSSLVNYKTVYITVAKVRASA